MEEVFSTFISDEFLCISSIIHLLLILTLCVGLVMKHLDGKPVQLHLVSITGIAIPVFLYSHLSQLLAADRILLISYYAKA